MEISSGWFEEQQTARLGIGESVELALNKSLFDKVRTLFTGNFYGSCPLPRILLRVRSRKYLPKYVITKKLKRQFITYRHIN